MKVLITVRGRTEKPLLRARPVRDSPKSTPRLNPHLQCGSFFRRRTFGGNSSASEAANAGGVWLRKGDNENRGETEERFIVGTKHFINWTNGTNLMSFEFQSNVHICRSLTRPSRPVRNVTLILPITSADGVKINNGETEKDENFLSSASSFLRNEKDFAE